MQSVLDAYLGIHAQALALEARRTDVLAANLANVDTPNYKARDLDFKAALAAASGQSGGATLGLQTTAPDDLTIAGTLAGAAAAGADPLGGVAQATAGANAGAADGAGTGLASAGGALPSAAGADALLKYRVPLAPALDGNTVDEQLEQAAFAENTVRYQASLTFLNVKLHDLQTAISPDQ
jgi:flagellar basal-body rod protein FlgB